MKYLIRKDIQLIINYKRIIITLLTSLLIFFAFSTMFKDYMEERRLLDQVHVGVVDREQSFITAMLIDNFKQNEAFSGLFVMEVGSEEELMTLYNRNELSAIVYLPEAFSDSLYAFENIPIEMKLNPNFPLQNTVLENIMSSYSTFIKSVDVGIYAHYNALKNEGMPREERLEINERFSLNMVMNALNRHSIFSMKPLDTYPVASALIYFSYSIMILVIIFIASSGSNIYNDEIHNGSLLRYLSTGQSLFKFTLSKTLVLSLNIAILLIPVLVILFAIRSMTLINFLMILVLFLLCILLFVSISLLLGILFHRYNINALMTTMITLTLGIIGGQFIPIQIMPSFIQDISSLTPNYWVLKYALELDQNYLSSSLWQVFLLMACIIIILSILQGYLIKRRHLWEK
ncbi:ABC transporter permease [Acidaminobacter sp. JC074]|uniref:ABC transporter permease n=1 Tax=Acidaminobacter sp. JC074 TaxID=2530199 RepID=UPI001F0E68CF|nr:ABC transporter permease [Acidaminobacter sp. JC074]MCH4889434.1 ABC transporter permease [Acidaminobacter sp. JC074]